MAVKRERAKWRGVLLLMGVVVVVVMAQPGSEKSILRCEDGLAMCFWIRSLVVCDCVVDWFCSFLVEW